MGHRDAGPHLTKEFIACLKRHGAVVDHSPRQTFVCINRMPVHIRYGNLNKNGDWWFGFLPADMVPHKDCRYALLLCGLSNFVKIYILPFEKLRTFLCTGSVVPGSNEYHAHIEPAIGNQMRVNGNSGARFALAPYRAYGGPMGPKLADAVLRRLSIDAS